MHSALPDSLFALTTFDVRGPNRGSFSRAPAPSTYDRRLSTKRTPGQMSTPRRCVPCPQLPRPNGARIFAALPRIAPILAAMDELPLALWESKAVSGPSQCKADRSLRQRPREQVVDRGTQMSAEVDRVGSAVGLEGPRADGRAPRERYSITYAPGGGGGTGSGERRVGRSGLRVLSPTWAPSLTVTVTVT